MFGQFFLFIVVLLIYASYRPPDTPPLGVLEAAGLFAASLIGFAAAGKWSFRRLTHHLQRLDPFRADDLLQRHQTRWEITAILLFALDVWALHLPAFTQRWTPFRWFPTLDAVLFLTVFLLHLICVWTWVYSIQRKIFGNPLGYWDFLKSQMFFGIPVYLPWLTLSFVMDIVSALPFEQPAKWLQSPPGQTTMFFVFLMGAGIFGPFLIQKAWRCTPLESGWMRDRIERLCRKAGFSYAEILYWPIYGGRMITAGVMGLVKRFRYLLVTEALLEQLLPEEIDAVIAHEIGHIKKKHLLFYLLFFAGYLLISYALFDFLLYALLFIRAFFDLSGIVGTDPVGRLSTISTVFSILLFLVYFRYGFGFFMRNFERQADAYVFTLFESARPLISTLRKIALFSFQPIDKPNWHHFSIAERIAFLARCELDRSWIRRHDRKIRLGLACYALVLLAFGSLAYTLNFGDTGKRLNQRMIEHILVKEIERNPDDAKLQAFLGDVLQSRKAYGLAKEAYEKAIALAPEHATALNNLAWMLVTCEDRRYFDPKTAVALAERAVRIQDSPQFLDTLAEAYYAAGRTEEAVAAGKRALLLATADHHYFEAQLKKFQQALSSVKPPDRSGGGLQ
ncbi:MAG: M48 family metalloprotease [Thermodesulfobacteriota bacterium]